MPISFNGTTGVTFADGSTQASAPKIGMVNRIINGDMRIDQRRAGASVTPTVTGAPTYTLDRWSALLSVTSKFSIQQNAGSVTPPAGFTNYLGTTSLSAYTVGASEFFAVRQTIEGFNVADLGWGTANAKTVTLSFWVRSSLIGTFGGAIRNDGNTRSYPYNFTISAANTWEYKTVTIAGDTTGTWAKNNTLGINLTFNLGAGSTVSNTAGSWYAGNFIAPTGAQSIVGTNGATFYITGVQFEVGTEATSFEYRQYQQELALCQRYYYKLFPQATTAFFGVGGHASSTQSQGTIQFPVTMRVAPTALEQSGTANQYATVIIGSANITCSAVPSFGTPTTNQAGFTTFTVASGLTRGEATTLRTDPTNGANAFLAWSAEL